MRQGLFREIECIYNNLKTTKCFKAKVKFIEATLQSLDCILTMLTCTDSYYVLDIVNENLTIAVVA